MARLLIVHHTPSPAVRALLEAAAAGAVLPDGPTVVAEPALSATASDLLAADTLLLITPANIGYMSGALKHFFDSIYYPCLDATRRLPWGLIVHGNDDTSGAVRSVDKIARALAWQQAAAVLDVVGAPAKADLQDARELGAVLAVVALERRPG
jgi:multimeric flavodoxin WrbA